MQRENRTTNRSQKSMPSLHWYQQQTSNKCKQHIALPNKYICVYVCTHTYIYKHSSPAQTHSETKTSKQKMHVYLHIHARTRHNNTTNTTNTRNRQQIQQYIHVYIYMYTEAFLKQDQNQNQTQKTQEKTHKPRQLNMQAHSHRYADTGPAPKSFKARLQTRLSSNMLLQHISVLFSPDDIIPSCIPVPKIHQHPQNHSAPAPDIHIALLTGT